MAAGRHLELCKILLWDRERIIICTGLIWPNNANMILYHNAFGSLACIILIEDHRVPGTYLFLAAILDLVWRWPLPLPKKYFQHQKQIRRPKISGIRDITLVSVSHWSKSRNSTNPTCNFGGHLECSFKMILKYNLNTRNGFIALKLVGLEVLLQYLCYIGQNQGSPKKKNNMAAGRHLELQKKLHREW